MKSTETRGSLTIHTRRPRGLVGPDTPVPTVLKRHGPAGASRTRSWSPERPDPLLVARTGCWSPGSPEPLLVARTLGPAAGRKGARSAVSCKNGFGC